jgi:hypothetical protein
VFAEKEWGHNSAKATATQGNSNAAQVSAPAPTEPSLNQSPDDYPAMDVFLEILDQTSASAKRKGFVKYSPYFMDYSDLNSVFDVLTWIKMEMMNANNRPHDILLEAVRKALVKAGKAKERDETDQTPPPEPTLENMATLYTLIKQSALKVESRE